MTTVEKSDAIKIVKPNVGIITPPDDIPMAQIYSDKQATKNFRQLHKDVFEGERHLNHLKDVGSFKGLLISTGIVAAFYFLIKNFSRLKIF